MVARGPQRTGWSPGVTVLALLFGAGALLTIVGPAFCPPPLPALSQPDDAEQDRVLVQYAEVLRNLTTRLEAAERAAVELRRRAKASDRVAAKIRAALLRYVEDQQQSPPESEAAAAASSDQDPDDADRSDPDDEKNAAAQQLRDELQARRKQKQLRKAEGGSDGEESDLEAADKEAAPAVPYASEDFGDDPDEDDPDQPAPLVAAASFSGDAVRAQVDLLKTDAGSIARFRPDFKCGSQVPRLPDGSVVECDSHGPSPCCSHLGWCGRTRGHCRCKECVIYRVADGSRR